MLRALPATLVLVLLQVAVTGAAGASDGPAGLVVVASDVQWVEEHAASLLAFLRGHFPAAAVQATADTQFVVADGTQLAFRNALLLLQGTPADEELSPRELGAFVDLGGNLLLATAASGAVAQLAMGEFGFEVSAPVTDHFHAIEDGGGGDGERGRWFAARPRNATARISGDCGKRPLVYHGLGLDIDVENPLAVEVVTAHSTAYARAEQQDGDDGDDAEEGRPEAGYPAAVGKSITLVGALQARNSARVVVAGSLALLSDRLTTNPAYCNQQFARHSAEWAFQLRGMLRVSSPPRLSHPDGTAVAKLKPGMLVRFDLGVETLVDGQWLPFRGDDVQVTLTQLGQDVVRQTLQPEGEGPMLSATFEVPPMRGTFSLGVTDTRVGWTSLSARTEVVVYPGPRPSGLAAIAVEDLPVWACAIGLAAGIVAAELRWRLGRMLSPAPTAAAAATPDAAAREAHKKDM